MRLTKRLLFFALICGGGYAAYAYFNPTATPQIHYITETVSRGNLDKSVLATGTVRAKQRVEVGAQVSGKIRKLYVALGQSVRQGQPLAELDAETQQNQLNTARAEFSAYQTQLNAKQVALNVAQSQYDRLAKLYAQKSGSLAELESAKQTLALAKANLDEIKTKIQVAEIAVNTATTNLGYTKIVSPIDGVVVSLPVSEGQTVNANQTSPTLLQVAALSQMLIKLEIAEGDIAQVSVGQKVNFSTLAEPNHRYQGVIQSLDPALTTLTDNRYNDQSGNSDAVYYYANVLVDNPAQRLRIGMTAQARILIAERDNALLVPSAAIQQQKGKTTVSVLENGKAVEKTVQVGLSDGQFSEILGGLTEGEQVITTQRNENEKVGGNNMRMPRF